MMINKIIHFSVYHSGLVLVMTVVLAIFGWISFEQLSIDAVPDITNNQVQVSAQVSGLAPEEIERFVTFPIEFAMGGIAGVQEVRSLTRFGISLVTIIFEDGSDIYRARQLVSERLQSVLGQLPPDVLPKLGPISTGLGEIFFYSIEPDKIETGDARLMQLMELRSLQDWYVRPRLLTVKGVAEVNTMGGLERQYHVQPDPKKMARFALQFSDITEALEATNKNVGGGYVQQTADQFLVQGVGLLKSIEEIENTPVKRLETFRTVYIKDIATVKLATELRSGASLVRGQETVLGTAIMLLGENGKTVANRVAERLKEIEPGLPPGYKIKPLFDRAVLVDQTLGTVEHNLMTGAGLVIIVLLFLLGNLRAALITALVIPLTLLLTFIVMKWNNISGNLLSLGALDFGIIVDGAVIVLDHCVRNIHLKVKELKRALTRQEVKDNVYQAAVEIRTAAGFGELIVVVVFLPIFALSGIEGKMFKPMAATFAIAVLCALMLSFSTVPALAGLFLSGNTKDQEPWLMRKVNDLYMPFLNFSLRNALKILFSAVACLGIALFLFLRLGGEFLPQMDEGSRAFQFIRPVNVTLDHSIALDALSQKLILRQPEVENVFSRLGTGEVATDPMGVNVSDTFVTFKPRESWKDPSKTWADVGNEIAAKLRKEIPGQRVVVSQPIEMRFNEMLEGTRADVSVKVYGDDMATLADVTTQIMNQAKKVQGAGEVEVELRGTSPVLKITPKAKALGQLAVPKLEVLETIDIALGGEEVGAIFDGVKRFPLIVRMNEKDRENLDLIRQLPVAMGANFTQPLSEVATVKFEEAYGLINREQSKRRAAVLINLKGRDTESYVNEAQALVAKNVKIPTGYFVEWGGNFKNLQQAKARLAIFAPLALLLVLGMIYFAFRSVFQTLLIFSCVPFALIGGIVNLVLMDMPFSISAGVGFIALSGIATLNGVVLMNVFNDLQAAGLSGKELVVKGATERIRPVLMTALVAIFGFIPMMISTGIGSEVQKPLATVVIGGIISSTFLTLVVIPILYLIFEKRMGRTVTGRPSHGHN